MRSGASTATSTAPWSSCGAGRGPDPSRACASRSSGSRGARRCSSWRRPAPAPTPCCSTATWTSSPRWSAGPRAPGRGRRCAAATSSTAAGAASGIVPSSFRILRQLLDRIEDSRTGEILPRDFHVDIPRERVAEAREVADVLGAEIYDRFPFPPGARSVSTDAHELILNNTWRPALAITGAAGLPLPADGGNVLRPKTSLKLSLRLPPTCDAGRAVRRLKEILEADPPYGARVTLETYGEAGNGWNAPATDPRLLESVNRASATYFGKPAMFHGLGGSIPFMSMLGQRFPRAQFLITGAMGPGSNAHRPNEFLHLPTGVKVTACVAGVIADHSGRSQT